MKIPKATKLPSGRWRVLVQIDGVRHSITRDTKKEAEQTAVRMKLSPQQRIARMTYGEAIDLYIAKYEKELSPSTINTYKSIRKNRFQTLMDMPINVGVDMQAVINQETVKPSTLRPAYSLLSASLKDLNIDSPKVRFPKQAKKERPFLDSEQIKTFCKIIRDDKFELAYLLCLHSLRCSEMRALKKEQVYNDTIHVSGALVKSENGYVYKPFGKSAAATRSIPFLIPRVAELIDARPEGTLCPYTVDQMDKHLRKILKENNLPVGSYHMLRHSFCSLCYFCGVSQKTCMKLGGWKSYQVMNEIYTHLSELQEKEDVEKLKRALSA